MEKPTIRISVRNLVEFILRSGDLDSRHGTSDKEAMLKGSRIHRKIQRQMGANYQAEVALKKTTEYDDLILQIEGRADGILQEDGEISVDEIKGIYKDVWKMEAPYDIHLAQAKCYAFIYGEQKQIEQISIIMTYANLDTEEIRRFKSEYSLEELQKWYENLLNEYHKWVSFQYEWKKQRNASMEKLEFPFEYRDGQKKMVSSVYHTISVGKQLFVQAPTGVGKTMSTIFPAVRAIGEGKGENIFYLTAKTITRTVAEEAFSILKNHGLLFKVITITAKEKLCFCEKTECNPDACPYAKGHFDRINDAVYELWTQEQVFDRELLKAHAEKWQVCPFEMCLDLAIWMDAVICDYNYAFDPNVHLKRFFGENVSGKYVFLIDEAHNLVERGREMYSASICKEDIMEVKKIVKSHSPKLARALERVNKSLLTMKKECEGYQIHENPGMITLQLLQVMGELEVLLEEQSHEAVAEEVLDFYFSVRDFLNISELVDENYVVYTEMGEDGKFRMKLFCVNPAENLKHYLEKGISTIFFSATLLPMEYYRNLLSVQKDDYGIYVPSPFDVKNRCILNGTDVSSKYSRRNYVEYRRMAEYIARVIWQKQGNYMVFFPSYRLMEEVYKIYEEEFSTDWVKCICQSQEMSEREREEFLNEFTGSEEKKYSLIGFCVMGGIFSEGIDLKGNQLIGVMIVGTGLPQVGNEREILKEFYDRKGENGFDYAYRYPGMNKILQSAGRVIRTKDDTGVILLLDERFQNRDYRRLFPVEWSDCKTCRIEYVEQELQNFWKRKRGDK